jgi:hypothetical protein
MQVGRDARPRMESLEAERDRFRSLMPDVLVDILERWP